MWRNSVNAKQYNPTWSGVSLMGKYSMYQLREADPNLPTTATIFDYPMRGEFISLKDAEEYCIAQGWKFKVDKSLYGGYYVEEKTGRSFIVI